MRCIRHVLYSRFCFLSEDSMIQCLKIATRTLSGSASGGGRKGQACRLDAMLSLLALLKQLQDESIPVQVCTTVFSKFLLLRSIDSLIQCLKISRRTLSGSASGGGRTGLRSIDSHYIYTYSDTLSLLAL